MRLVTGAAVTGPPAGAVLGLASVAEGAPPTGADDGAPGSSATDPSPA